MPVVKDQIGGVIVAPSISQFKVPLPFWHRVEPRSRTDDFARSIQAPIQGPLWMLTRQLQFGEFRGDDGASPVSAIIETKSTKLAHVRLGTSAAAAVRPFSLSTPLETVVERECANPVEWRSSVRIGQQFERELRNLLNKGDITEDDYKDIVAEFKRRYPLTMPEQEPLLELDDPTREFLRVVAGRTINGNEMVSSGVIAENPVPPADLGIADELTSPVRDALKKTWEWRRLLYGEGPEGAPAAWQRSRLEYEFHVSAPDPDEDGEIVLVTREYDGRLLDWPDFSMHADPDAPLSGEGGPAVVGETMEFIPTPLFFRGMPNHRWWEFEDRQINFGDLTVNTTDLGKLILMEFALIHGADWFLFPLPLEVGSLCFIQKLTVTDVFGQETPITRAGGSETDDWQEWAMFHLAVENATAEEHGSRNEFLFLPPTLPRSDQSPPLDEVVFLRDEMANMVWAVERTILNGLGQPLSGYEAYRGRLRRLREQADREKAAQVIAAADQLGELAAEAAAAAAAAGEATTPEAVASHAEAAEEALRAAQELANRATNETGELSEQAGQGPAAPIAYRLLNTVPENWIPYVAFHTGNRLRAIELRQASMVRNQENLQPVSTRPRSYLLAEAGAGHRLHEETVSRAATRLRLVAQRARWIDGTTHVWLGRNVGPGGGEGSSGLRFDLVVDRVKGSD